MSDTAKHRGMTRLRNYFLTGLVVCAPLAITAYLSWSLIGWVDSWVKPYIPLRYNPDSYLPFAVPGFGLIVAVVLITLIGFLTANFIGRTIVSYGEYLLGRMPLVRSIYRGLKQIFETVLSHKSDVFKKVGLIEYPRRGAWAIVFISSERESEVNHLLEPHAGRTIAVFLPSTPNPTTGFLMYVPKTELIELSMSVEEAAKLVISAGLVTPEYQKMTQKLADDALVRQPKRSAAE
ncbi:DUF502 domain-containing protein [Nitratireductor sp. CAU 1489]|uniref:DUF502 domain-containing protein n=1 Tax=Nitratireductor arenosus TaxID=2682096 RepID=A0A844QFF8_9HYPH|nr:DUF502 domain-containing protein [Nitratireductor arenosus]MVA97807.1 DUF502 domain-containing protein [Nitratireductor arenosus]